MKHIVYALLSISAFCEVAYNFGTGESHVPSMILVALCLLGSSLEDWKNK